MAARIQLKNLQTGDVSEHYSSDARFMNPKVWRPHRPEDKAAMEAERPAVKLPSGEAQREEPRVGEAIAPPPSAGQRGPDEPKEPGKAPSPEGSKQGQKGGGGKS